MQMDLMFFDKPKITGTAGVLIATWYTRQLYNRTSSIHFNLSEPLSDQKCRNLQPSKSQL